MGLVELSTLFNIENGSDLELNKLKKTDEGINYISRTMKNNGVKAQVSVVEGKVPKNPNTISVTLGGSVLEAFLQDKEYYTSYHVAVLTPLEPMTKQEMLYYCMCIRANKFRYNFGRQANKTIASLKVPSKESIPKYVNTTEIKDLYNFTKKLIKLKTPKLNSNEWKEFTFDDLFIIKNGYYNKKPIHSKKGKIAFLGATANNNGVTEYYSIEDIAKYHRDGTTKKDELIKKVFDGNCIAVTNNGSVGCAFYQKDPFTCSHDVNPLYLRNHELNKYSAMFLITIIEQEKFRWTYDRKWRPYKMPKSVIKLPIKIDENNQPILDHNGKYIPDYMYMENYIKTLSYSKEL